MLNSARSERDATVLSQAETDALLEAVSEQLDLDQFDSTNHQLLKQMVESLGDTRGLIRLSFAEALGDIGEPATPFLLEALANHANPVVRRAAGKTLTLIADPKAVPTLVHALLHDEDTVVKGSVVGALARTGAAAVPALLDILASSEYPESAKGHAAWALSFIGAEAADYVYAAMNSESVDVRCAAVGAIGNVAQENADERAYSLLMTALHDPAAVVRTEAASALGKLHYPPAVPLLIAATRDPDGEVRKAAVSSLGKLGDSAAIEPLQAALNDDLDVVRLLAKIAIGQIERQAEADWA